MSDEIERKEPEASPETLGETLGPALSPAARRALDEAAARKAAADTAEQPKELGGRGGPEPTRYGDWEKDGIAYDF